MSLRANSEAEAFHFLTMLRQCVRMDFHQQTMKMYEFKQRSVKTGNMRYQVGTPLTMQSGVLEVVLVEARRLRPTRVQKWKDMQEQIYHKVMPALNPYVTFKLINRGEPHEFDASKHCPMKNGEVWRMQFDSIDTSGLSE